MYLHVVWDMSIEKISCNFATVQCDPLIGGAAIILDY